MGRALIERPCATYYAQGARTVLRMMGQPVDQMDDQAVAVALERFGKGFRDRAPTTAERAVKIILAGVKEDRWRILVGDDAVTLDAAVRAAPEEAYEVDFSRRLR